MAQRLRQVLPHFVMLLVSLALYWAATRIDTSATGGGNRVGPDFWPKLVVGAMALLCVYEIVKRLVIRTSFTAAGMLKGLDRDPTARSEAVKTPTPAPLRAGQLTAGVVLVLGYVLAVPWLGFFITSALFLFGFAWIGGFRRPLVALLIALVGALSLVVIFMRIAYISLPLGAGPFRELSLALTALLGVR